MDISFVLIPTPSTTRSSYRSSAAAHSCQRRLKADPQSSIGGSTPRAATTRADRPLPSLRRPYCLAEAPGAASLLRSETLEFCGTLSELDSWHDQIGSVAGLVGSEELVLFFHPSAP